MSLYISEYSFSRGTRHVHRIFRVTANEFLIFYFYDFYLILFAGIRLHVKPVESLKIVVFVVVVSLLVTSIWLQHTKTRIGMRVRTTCAHRNTQNNSRSKIWNQRKETKKKATEAHRCVCLRGSGGGGGGGVWTDKWITKSNVWCWPKYRKIIFFLFFFCFIFFSNIFSRKSFSSGTSTTQQMRRVFSTRQQNGCCLFYDQLSTG